MRGFILIIIVNCFQIVILQFLNKTWINMNIQLILILIHYCILGFGLIQQDLNYKIVDQSNIQNKMLKPKNISIKKITQSQPQQKQPQKQSLVNSKKDRVGNPNTNGHGYGTNNNSRKSLKAPKTLEHCQYEQAGPMKKNQGHGRSGHPSPIHLMKQQSNASNGSFDDNYQHGNFIKYINGYLNQLDGNSRHHKNLRNANRPHHSKQNAPRQSQRHSNPNFDKQKQFPKTLGSNMGQQLELATIRRKIFKQKQINRSLQKNIVQFQKILLQRNDKIDKLQKIVYHLQNKQNCMKVANGSRNIHPTKNMGSQSYNIKSHVHSQSKSRHKQLKRIGIKQISSELQGQMEQQTQNYEYQYQPKHIATQSQLYPQPQLQYQNQCQCQQQLYQLCNQGSSQQYANQLHEQKYNRYKQRRKTEMPSQIERIISKTMAVRPHKYMQHKHQHQQQQQERGRDREKEKRKA